MMHDMVYGLPMCAVSLQELHDIRNSLRTCRCRRQLRQPFDQPLEAVATQLIVQWGAKKPLSFSYSALPVCLICSLVRWQWALLARQSCHYVSFSGHPWNWLQDKRQLDPQHLNELHDAPGFKEPLRDSGPHTYSRFDTPNVEEVMSTGETFIKHLHCRL